MAGQERLSGEANMIGSASAANAEYAKQRGAWNEYPESDIRAGVTGTWSGSAGAKYHDRQVTPDRSGFWEAFLDEFRPSSVLEAGCGTGFNLVHIPGATGVDVSPVALAKAPRAIHGDVLDLPFKARTFELVFTCGVLIHQPMEKMATAMEEMNRVSSKYVMLMEYYCDEWKQMPYRDGLLLWKGPFNEMYEDIFAVEPIDQGFLRRTEGFDNVTWWLYPRQ